jgi:hypothetical protein
MDRRAAYTDILTITGVARAILSSRLERLQQAQQAATPRRSVVQPKIPLPRSKPLKAPLEQLGLSSKISKQLADAYRRRVVSLKTTVKQELKQLWARIQENSRYTDEEVAEKYTLSAEAILRQYRDGLKTAFDVAILAVNAHFHIEDGTTHSGKFDEVYILLD